MRGQPVPAQAAPPIPDRGAALGSDAQLAAVAGAAATLAQQIAVQTGAIAANTAALANANRQERGDGGRGGRDRPQQPVQRPNSFDPLDKAGASLAGTLRGFAASLIAPLLPLAAFAQVLSTTTSGFGAFLKMTGLITTSLAALFLPAMLVAGGVVYALAMEMQGPLLDAVTKLGREMEGMQEAAKAVHDVWDELKKNV